MSRAASHVAVALTPRILVGGARAFGPGKADLLERIEETGSISAAARALKMSYSRAWSLVDEMNHAFKSPLVETAAGGKSGGGARVTASGRKALAAYRKMRAHLEENANSFASSFAPLLK